MLLPLRLLRPPLRQQHNTLLWMRRWLLLCL
jgi:hypothetical protein